MEQPTTGGLGKWLMEQCQKEHLSLRQVAAKTNLSHTTIAAVLSGANASPQTIRKLAQGFGDGRRRLILEDKLLVLAGHRTQHQHEELTEPMARLIDKLEHFSEPQLSLLGHFADFLSGIEKEKD